MKKRMNPIYKLLLVFAIILGTCLINTKQFSAGEIVINKEQINREFMELQNKIDVTVTVKNGKYIYNRNEIENIIENSNFDFEELNNEFNTNYTKETFLNDVIVSLKETMLPDVTHFKKTFQEKSFISRAGGYCNNNSSSQGWNYYREFTSESVTAMVANDLDKKAIDSAFVGTLGGIFSGIIGLPFGYQAWYYSTLANSMRTKMSGCGVVTDLNKFTTAFTVWDQRNF